MDVIRLRDEYIKLGQALKAAGLVDSGAEAKEVIVEGSLMAIPLAPFFFKCISSW